VSDFLGGLTSRRLPALTVVLAVETAGLVIVAVAIAVVRPPWFDDSGQVLAAALAGLSGVIGLTAFFRALAVGTMSIVAPVSSTGLVVPVLVGIASGQEPAPVQGVGIACAALGIVLAGREAADDEQRDRAAPGLGLALVAAAGFGGYFVGADEAADGGVLMTLLVARAAAVPVLAALTAAQGQPLLPPSRAVAARLAGIGALDLTATGLYAAATTKGLLAVVGVLGSLYPVTTVLLARAVLGERLAGVQRAGVIVALAGVALIAAG
jgi:drug/metabolite transporter (DMT)-like permease